MRSFTDEVGGQRVVFGAGTLGQVGEELARLGGGRPLVLATPEQRELAERVAAMLGGAATFTGAAMHTPVAVTEEALAAAGDADSLVSVGGGSTTGLGKAVSVRTGLPHLVVPTTYAGSESTPVLGETASGEKTTRSAPEILPDAVLYDVELTTTLPWPMTLTSGVNAMAHAVEALYSPDRTEDTDAMAEDCLRAIAGGLRARAADLDARAELLYGAWLGGRCLAAVGMGLHHKLCHTLGGSFGLPHAPTHTVVLPYAMEYNAGPGVRRASAAIGTDDLQSLVAELGGPTDLGGLGFDAADVDRAAELATARPYPNPREVTRDGIADLLGRATAGTPIGALT
ncbi:maleylacetate reductase [Nocardioides mangrovicus]|uniref:Maleylacetate reductase n=1 Tax=Nocardioides mangrovicus TaxID=2478913 RepID=A0A3L8P756_9ACTN|nr:maleylacetate reductase [Nocardioides mangrovicus]RLV50954.1 maleylacetate reductase [Nocardioides mangrovicus]